MNQPTITPEQHLTVLKHLAAGKDIPLTAVITNIPTAQVTDIAKNHGHPDRDKLAWAVDVLVKNIDKAATAGIPEASPATTRAAASPTPIHRDQPRAPIGTRPDELRALLNAAKAANPKRIQSLANKIFDDLDRLRGILDAERAKQEAKERETREQVEARAEIARLEKQLANAKAKLRGAKKSARAAATANPAPPPEATHACPGCEKKFTTPQGRALHQTKHCPATHPVAS